MSAQIREVESQKSRVKGLQHKTRNNLDEKTRQASVELLNARLADGIDLALAVKQAHWNLRGPQFIAIHELLDTFRAELDAGNEVTLAPGDVVVQNGTRHAWRNRSTSPATMLFVLIGARRNP